MDLLWTSRSEVRFSGFHRRPAPARAGTGGRSPRRLAYVCLVEINKGGNGARSRSIRLIAGRDESPSATKRKAERSGCVCLVDCDWEETWDGARRNPAAGIKQEGCPSHIVRDPGVQESARPEYSHLSEGPPAYSGGGKQGPPPRPVQRTTQQPLTSEGKKTFRQLIMTAPEGRLRFRDGAVLQHFQPNNMRDIDLGAENHEALDDELPPSNGATQD